MHKISDKDKKIWNFYTSNLDSIKKVDKNKKLNTKSISTISKDLKPNIYFSLDSRTKRKLNSDKLVIDAMIDLHGKTEVQAYEIIKNFIKKSYLNELKSIIIITGKGANSKGKLKLKTPLWLKNEELSKFVVGFENMPNNKGGDGALFIKLKNKNKYK
tara:strand:+ start:200 stop:673 length:474 start_codon:yes stop_codon:yes gene_type:complete